ncbi:MAG: acetyl-CoA carboxylase biotin carboxyl carrier protein [Longimicrobiales bacterium]
MAAEGREPRKSASGRSRGSSRASDGGPAALANGAPDTGPGVAQLMIDLDFVRGLIAAVDDSSIDTLEINRGGTRIRISKTPLPGPVAAVAAPVPVAGPGAAATAPSPQAAEAAASAAPAEAPASNLTEVRSPMVGTFYRAPAPEAPAYVEVGSHVTKGQTLCILEAMKLMNELEAEVDGVVREILVSNADPVEYGQVLFMIEPA